MLLAFSIIACGFSINTGPDEPTLKPVATLRELTPSKPDEPVKLISQPTSVSYALLTTSEEGILVDLYRRVNPSVVNIITYVIDQGFSSLSGQGSGFLYDTDGHIITNSHVIHGADSIEVIFSDGFSVGAQVVGEDLHSDLAVLKVEQLPANLTPLPLANMDQIAVGQTAVALGNPFGLGGTLTRGIISAMGRSIPALTPFSIPQAIQTDAPINPGNSGGPLMNLAGEVIGVNAQIETDGESRSNSGVGFAIPVSIISRVIPKLISDGSYEWGWLGVMGGNLNSTLREAMELSVEKGAYVSQVVTDGPADRAGLRGSNREVIVENRRLEIGGDVIVGIDGIEVSSFEDILIYLTLNTNPGQNIVLTIIRDGEAQDITLTLQPRPNGAVESNLP